MGLQALSSWVLNSCSHQPPKPSWHSLPICSVSASPQPLMSSSETLGFRRCRQIEETTLPLWTNWTKVPFCPFHRNSHNPFSFLSHNKANSHSRGLTQHFQMEGDSLSFAWAGYCALLVAYYRPHMTTEPEGSFSTRSLSLPEFFISSHWRSSPSFSAEHGTGSTYSLFLLGSRDASSTSDPGYFLCLCQLQTSGKISQI